MVSMHRRLFLSLPGLAFAQRRTVFLPSPGKGTAVMAYAFYTERSGGRMDSIEQRWSKSDTIDIAYRRHSTDHGVTWSKPEPIVTGEKRPEGMYRKHLRCGYVDPASGRYLEFFMQGILPTDDPLEGMRRWELFYTYAGKSHRIELPGLVTPGKNSATLGDNSSTPLTLPDGTICLPVEVTPVGPNGEYHNPGKGYTWHETVVLRGRWHGGQLRWETSNILRLKPEQSTRGALEPTLARLAEGRLMLVCRASNDKAPENPSYRWVSYSHDEGRTWSELIPWTYDNGGHFFSPAPAPSSSPTQTAKSTGSATSPPPTRAAIAPATRSSSAKSTATPASSAKPPYASSTPSSPAKTRSSPSRTSTPTNTASPTKSFSI